MFTGLAMIPLAIGMAAAAPPSADDIARVLLQCTDAQEANSRLAELDPRLVDGSWALQPLLDRVVAGTDTPEHLNAVCHMDAWSDGAWWLEMEGAAFDAVSVAPERFARRYVEENDCALLMFVYALRWTYGDLEATQDCQDDLTAAFARFDAAVGRIRDGASSVVSLDSENPRNRILFETVNALVDLSRSERAAYQRWCDRQGAQAPGSSAE